MKHGASCVVCSERVHRIPATAIKKVLNANGIDTVNRGKKWAELVGVVSTETVSQIIRGNRKNVGFDTADKILVALESPELWYTDLREYYHAGPVPEYEKEGDVQLTFEMACDMLEDIT